MSGDNDVLRPGGLCLELRVCTRQAPRRTPEQSHSALSSEPRGTAYGPLDPNSDPNRSGSGWIGRHAADYGAATFPKQK
jgi:hypothetical protein